MNVSYINNWHVLEAQAIQDAFPKAKKILLETGFGPSGAIHIGTLVENIRTDMVLRGFQAIDDRPIEMQCIVDDLDGLRKVPQDLSNQDLLAKCIDYPLYKVLDPLGEYDSMATRNIKAFEKLIEQSTLPVKILRSSDVYKSGFFNEKLLAVLAKYREILDIILPTLSPERRKTYSPFMPICPKSSRVLARGVCEYKDKTIVYRNAYNELVETPVTDGYCKLQWHVDFGMRWAAFGVNYEMYGKDLLPSVKLAKRICSAIGGTPPIGMMYELFLNEDGAKISKSKGNSSILPELWAEIAPRGSLYYFAHQNPRRAKRLDVMQLPVRVDSFLDECASLSVDKTVDYAIANPKIVAQNCDSNTENFKIANNDRYIDYMPQNLRIKSSISYQLLVQLAVISNGDKDVVRGMLNRRQDLIPESELLDTACNFATQIMMKNRILKDLKHEWQKEAIKDTIAKLKIVEESPEAIQYECYEIGKKYAPHLKDWFITLYEGLFGDTKGPRIGTFFAYLGRERAIGMLEGLLLRSSDTTRSDVTQKRPDLL